MLVSDRVRLAHAARDFLGRDDVGFSSVVALLVFIWWPLFVLALLSVDCLFFPVQHHAINVVIGYGAWVQAEAWLVFGIWDLGSGGFRAARFWERIVRKAWALVAVMGGLLGGFVWWLGRRGEWRLVAEKDFVAEVHFVAIFYAAVAASLWAFSGCLYLLAKALLRRGSGVLGTLAYIFSVFIMLLSAAMSLLMFREAVGWGMVGVGEIVQ